MVTGFCGRNEKETRRTLTMSPPLEERTCSTVSQSVSHSEDFLPAAAAAAISGAAAQNQGNLVSVDYAPFRVDDDALGLRICHFELVCYF